MLFNIILKIEKYKWNKEYGVYVSNLGHFKDRYKRRLPVKINKQGYIVIETEKGFKLGHRMAMLTWRPIPNAEELTVDHLDHNKRNNELMNLEWVTKEENLIRAEKDFINHKSKEDEHIYFYYLYNKNNKELLFKLKTIEEVMDIFKKYYFGEYVHLMLNKKELIKKIDEKAKSNKQLKNKKLGMSLLIDYR